MEKEIKSLDDLKMKTLLNIIFEHSYDNDKVLYANLDKELSAFACRSNLLVEERKFIEEYYKSNDINVNDLLIRAINKADYADTLKFSRAFVSSLSNTLDLYAYTTNGNANPYEWISKYIKAHEKELEKKNLNYMFRSTDEDKYGWFRDRLRDFKKERKYQSINLLEKYYGSNSIRTVIPFISYDSMMFDVIIDYIIDNNIVPDSHNDSLEYKDPFGADNNYFPRKIDRSFNLNHMRDLIYLTAYDLKVIFEKHKLIVFDKHENAVFNYIKSLKDRCDGRYLDSSDKYFIYIA